jgi:hypothetical protein
MEEIGKSPPRVIAVDFDGTLCEHSFPEIGALRPGAREALTMFRDIGYKVLIYTCRTSHWHYDIFGGDPEQPTLERERVQEMIVWLAKHEIPYDEIDDGSRGKPLADYYIDDKGIRFNNNWGRIAFFVFDRYIQNKEHA